MPFAVTHILVAVVLVELFREYFVKNNKIFPRYYILIAAIGGLIPDLDIPINLIFNFPFGKNPIDFLHILLVPFALFLIGIAAHYSGIKSSEARKRHMKLTTIFFILAATSLIHLGLDLITTQNAIFYPFSNIMIGFNVISLFPESVNLIILPIVDGLLLLFWLFWMEFKLKITDYF
ncbi:MAG: metal-dependent hydrolase [Candidatus Nanoarchaeia archaeon]